MKLAPEALLEIVNILRTGLAEGKDVSQALRELDLVVDPTDPSQSTLALSVGYKAVRAAAEQT